MKKKIDPVVDEAIETLNMKDGPSRRRLLEGAGLFSATAAASALLAACSSSSSSSAAPTATASSAAAVAGNFPKTPAWQFWFVNHVYTNTFFVPTQYGYRGRRRAARPPDAEVGRLRTTSTVSQMVSYLQTARSPPRRTASRPRSSTPPSFTTPVANAMNAGIPVVTYNADGTYTKRRAGHRHQPALLRRPGALPVRPADGRAHQVPRHDAGEIVIFIATPGHREHPAPLRRRRVGARRRQGTP